IRRISEFTAAAVCRNHEDLKVTDLRARAGKSGRRQGEPRGAAATPFRAVSEPVAVRISNSGASGGQIEVERVCGDGRLDAESLPGDRSLIRPSWAWRHGLRAAGW